MKYLALLLIFGFGLSGFGQTIKSLGYNTTNGQVVANTAELKFTNETRFGDLILNNANGAIFIPDLDGAEDIFYFDSGPESADAQRARNNLGFSTNLNTLWTATNVINARSAVGLGSTNTPSFRRVVVDPQASGALGVQYGANDSGLYNGGTYNILSLRVGGINALTAETNGVTFANPDTVRTNLGLGWPALTNSNSGIGLVSVNSNGTVVSPANFWSNAPISSVIDLSTTNATGVLPVGKGGTGGTNSDTALTNLGIFPAFAAVVVGGSNVTGGNTVVGAGATADDGSGLGGVAIGRSVVVSNSAIGVGYAAIARDISGGTGIGGVAVGYQATNISSGGASIGYRAQATNGGAVGREAAAFNGFAGGDQAKANAVNAVQLGTGTLTNSNNIQFLSAGAVDTNEWNALANASILGRFTLTNSSAESLRNEIGLGATNTVTFSNVANNGDFTNNNGTIYGLKTNVGPFEGIGNFLASNNTTVGNETLFRVGVAETTNKSAQFGFRVTRTNNGGEGLAVFSVFGYNALMMIGPSDRSRSNSLTNTNAAIEADIWTMHETNRVMTLRDTNTGATVMHRPIGFNTNEVSTTAPSNTTVTNPTGWIQMYVGTNSVRVPYYQ